MIWTPTPTFSPNYVHPLNRGLITWWLSTPGYNGFGSSVWRDMCNRNHGSLVNMDPATDWVTTLPRPGGLASLDIDVGDDQVVSDANPALALGQNGTISLWVYFRTLPAGVHQLIGTHATGSAYSNGFLIDQEGTTLLGFWQTASPTLNLASTLSAGSWLHIVLANVNDSCRFYINGKAIGSASAGGGTITNTALRLAIGGSAWEPDALVDSIRISSVGLTAEQVWQLYQEEIRGYPGLLNRVCIFPFVPSLSPKVESSTSNSDSGAATSITVTKPVGVINGELMLAIVSWGTGSPGTITPPTGWTLEYTPDFTASGMESRVYKKIAGGAEPADYTWTWVTGRRVVAGIHRISGADTVSTIGQSASSDAGLNLGPAVAPAVITTVADTLIIRSFNIRGGGTSQVPDVGQTQQWATLISGAAGLYGASFTRPQSTIGGSGTFTVSYTDAGSDQWTAFTLAIKPAVITSNRRRRVLLTGGTAV